MSDPTQKSSEELAAELLELMPKLKSAVYGWRAISYKFQASLAAKTLWHTAQLVLAQQQEIEQLKAELRELKNQ